MLVAAIAAFGTCAPGACPGVVSDHQDSQGVAKQRINAAPKASPELAKQRINAPTNAV